MSTKILATWWSVRLTSHLSYVPRSVGEDVNIMGEKLGNIVEYRWTPDKCGIEAFALIRLSVPLDKANKMIEPLKGMFEVLETAEAYYNDEMEKPTNKSEGARNA